MKQNPKQNKHFRKMEQTRSDEIKPVSWLSYKTNEKIQKEEMHMEPDSHRMRQEKSEELFRMMVTKLQGGST